MTDPIKILLIVSIVLFQICFAKAQNLVANPGFEQVTQDYNCTINASGNNQNQRRHYYDHVYHWRTGKRCAPCLRLTPTPDVLCNGFMSYQANTGTKFGQTVQETSGYQEYLVGSLSSPLRNGTTYYVEYHINTAYAGVQMAGLAFSVGVPCQCGKGLPDYPDAKVPIGSAGNVAGSWQKVRGVFRADKSYDHVLLGHFAENNLSVIRWDDVTVRVATTAEINELDWTGLTGDQAEPGWLVGNFNVRRTDIVMDDRNTVSLGSRGASHGDEGMDYKMMPVHRPGKVMATAGKVPARPPTTTQYNPDDILRFHDQNGGADVLLSNRSTFSAPNQWSGEWVGNRHWYVGDFNGDGNDDILKYRNRHGGGVICLSNGHNGFGPGRDWTGAGVRNKGWYVGDFNGDGKDDLLRQMNEHGGGEVFLSNGQSFDPYTRWTGSGNRRKGWTVGDFNGDGKDDLLRYRNDQGGAEVLLSTGVAFQSPVLWSSYNVRKILEDRSRLIGSGKYIDRWYTGDFNGDGKDDLLRFAHNRGGAEVLLSTGSSFQNAVGWTNEHLFKRGWHIGDFNGDGKDDIFRYKDLNGGAMVLLSTGSGFSSPAEWTGEPVRN